MSLRLMIFDRTCRGRGLSPGLSHAWSAGGALYRALGRIDAYGGARSWTEALDWIVEEARREPIAEIQFWGHGEWGGLWIDEELLDARALAPGHYLHERLVRVRDRLAADARWWFRSCDVFGAPRGQDFARRWTRFFGCRAAGHTHQIMVWQSGLHELAPGAEPTWSPDEGVVDGLWHAADSGRSVPRTITCFHNRVPR